jgi:hypothetical protein
MFVKKSCFLNFPHGIYRCHFTQPSSAEIIGKARGLSESASGGRVSQRPVILSSAGESVKDGPNDRLPFLFVSFSFGQAKKKKVSIKKIPCIEPNQIKKSANCKAKPEFSRRSNAAIRQALSLGRDDKKKGGYGQQLFRILLIKLRFYIFNKKLIEAYFTSSKSASTTSSSVLPSSGAPSSPGC